METSQESITIQSKNINSDLTTSDIPMVAEEIKIKIIANINIEDPETWNRDQTCINYVLTNSPKQDPIKLNFSASVVVEPTQKRYARQNMFFRKLKNKEVRKREWMIYSVSNGKIFCMYCKLFGDTENSFCTGFKDWKHEERIRHHETSSTHQKSEVIFITRFKTEGRVDEIHEKQIDEEKQY